MCTIDLLQKLTHLQTNKIYHYEYKYKRQISERIRDV